MGYWFNRFDTWATVHKSGLPIKPIDPGLLPARVRDILPEWALDYNLRLAAARESANKD